MPVTHLSLTRSFTYNVYTNERSAFFAFLSNDTDRANRYVRIGKRRRRRRKRMQIAKGKEDTTEEEERFTQDSAGHFGPLGVMCDHRSFCSD